MRAWVWAIWLFALMGPVAFGAENLVNGGTFTGAVDGVYDEGSKAVPGWTVYGGTVTVQSKRSHSLVWSGGQAGGIRQTISTRPGQLYRVFCRLYGIHAGELQVNFGSQQATYPTVGPETANDIFSANWFRATSASTELSLRPNQDKSTEISILAVEVSPVDLANVDTSQFISAYRQMDDALKTGDVSGYLRWFTSDFGGRDAEGTALSMVTEQDFASNSPTLHHEVYDMSTNGPVVTVDVETMSAQGDQSQESWSHQSWLKTPAGWRIYCEQGVALLVVTGYIKHTSIVKDIHPPDLQTYF